MVNAVFGWKALLVNLPRSAALCRGILGSWVMTTGNGPLDELDFDEFLSACNVYVICPFYSTREDNVLIIGHDDWNKDFLDYIIETHAGGILRVYSQEMVITSLALGADIFEVLSAEELRTFGNGHSALEYLSQNLGFEWPTTDIVFSSNRLVVDFANGVWPEHGVLNKMGYKVGKQGLVESSRRSILRKVREVHLQVGSDSTTSYIKAWGSPMSSKRLSKMAECIASFARAKKRMKTYDNRQAIADYEADLAWLKQTYYQQSNMKFWPNTNVP